MGGLLHDIQRVSGPVSYFVFKMPATGNMVYMFGDYHFSYRNQCTKCTGPCVHVTDLIDKALADAKVNRKSMDVFMEFPYVTSDADLRARVLARIDEIFMRDGRVPNVLSKLFGKSPEYIGIFSLLYKRFSNKFYSHPPGPNLQRFHYGDARAEPNVARFLSPSTRRWIEMFHRRVPDVKTFRRMLDAFILGYRRDMKSFQEEMYGIFEGDIPVFVQSLSAKKPGARKTLHKISKQVYKLPPALRAPLESYLTAKLDAICETLQNDVRYEDGIRLLAEPIDNSNKSNKDGTLTLIRASRLANYMGIFVVFIDLIVKTIMMDAYMLARMLYYTHRPESAHGTTIVYAGDFHVGVYADFFTRYMRLEPLGCSVPEFPMHLNDQQLQAMVQRCVQVNLGSCNYASSPKSPKSPKSRQSRQPHDKKSNSSKKSNVQSKVKSRIKKSG